MDSNEILTTLLSTMLGDTINESDRCSLSKISKGCCPSAEAKHIVEKAMTPIRQNKLMSLLLERMFLKAEVDVFGWGRPCIKDRLDAFKNGEMSDTEAEALIYEAVRDLHDSAADMAIKEMRDESNQ